MLPDSLELPVINPKKVVKMPVSPGRTPGAINKITRDLKEGLLDAAIAHGSDGHGEAGLHGYLFLLASENRKTFAGLLAKILPYNVTASVAKSTISEVRILSVPAGTYLKSHVIAEMEANPHAIQAEEVVKDPERYLDYSHEQIEEPAAHESAPLEPVPELNPRLAALEARLATMSRADLLRLAGVTDEDD